MMLRHKKLSLLAAVFCLVMTACDDDNSSTLPALDMPGEMHIVERCAINGTFVKTDEAACKESGGTYSRRVYAANMSTGTLSYIPFYSGRAEFEVIDITKAVPGVTSIPVGQRPQSVSGDELGAFVVLTSSIKNDLSIISVNDNREIAYQELDKTPQKIVYESRESDFLVFFQDGTVRRLKLSFDCGAGENVLKEDCELTKDKIKISWETVTSLAGSIFDYVTDPVRSQGYVTYQDRRYVSVLGFSEEAGTCLDGAGNYPCETARLGAGFGCSDGIDNDGNGLIDRDDPSCFYPWSMEGTDTSVPQTGWFGIGECNDGIDNNGNGFIDALDPGCVAANDASEEPGFQAMTLGTCGDGTDNDGDGDLDRDDVKCRWPSGDEASASELVSVSAGLCRDGIDNDGDGKIDAEDLACYGKNGFGESELTSLGRGAVSIDPLGRWLYVLDPVDSQLIVIDLETGKTLDRSGWFPRNRVVGIPVSRLALDVVGDTRSDIIYNRNSNTVYSDRAVVFVSSSSGAVSEYLIHQKLTHYKKNVEGESVEELALRPTDTDDDSSYVGTVRCIGRICTEQDLPVIALRRRPAISYFSNYGVLSQTNPETGKPHSVIYDSIMASETWRITYEGTLERETRTDGVFPKEGVFKTGLDLCALGARKGDHLVLTKRDGVKKAVGCEVFNQDNLRLEWEIVEAGVNSLTVQPTGVDGDVTALPRPECFTSGLNYEIRASNEWIITSKTTFVNKRYSAGMHCIDNPMQPYGQTRFKLAPEKADGTYDAQTAFFSVTMPVGAEKLVRGDAFEFTTRTGQSALTIGMRSTPSAMKLFKTDNVHFLLISDAGGDMIVVYDVDDESVDDTL